MQIRLMAQVTAGMESKARRQMPFVLSLAINRTAVGARDKVRQGLPQKFTLRNQYTVRGIMARPGNKADPTAVIRAPGYMAIQETGGTIGPSGRNKTRYAPSDILKSRGIVPRDMRPGRVLADRAFILQMPHGDAGVFLRYGKQRRQIRLLWWLTEDHRYEDIFEFELDVQDYVQDKFPEAFRRAMLQAFERGEYAPTPWDGPRERKAKLSGAARRKLARQDGA